MGSDGSHATTWVRLRLRISWKSVHLAHRWASWGRHPTAAPTGTSTRRERIRLSATLFTASLYLAAAPACAQDREPVLDRQSADAQRFAPVATPAAPERTVAVTFDDLPGVVRGGLPALQAVTARLLGHIGAAGIPAIGFVNEDKLAVAGEEAQRTALLDQWLETGSELGNYTYSHPSLYRTPLAEYQADVLRGERVTTRLLAARGERPRYFRHPFLNTGPDLKTKEAFERFLDESGYAVAPVTIDNDEWLYAAAYTNAIAQGNSALMRRIGSDYVRYMDETFAFYEQLSRNLLGREIAQVLLRLCHIRGPELGLERAELIGA